MKSYNTFVSNVLPKINTFDDFYNINKDHKNKQVGDFFEIITKYVFLLHNYYKNITKQVWLYDEIPYDLIKKLGIPEKDKGIDLVLLTQDGKYYAIQCKFRNNINIKIPWGELGTFVGMSFGISDKFSGAFFVTNTESINQEVLNCDKIVKLYGDFFDTLDGHFFEKMKNHINSAKGKFTLKNREKRTYQKEFISKCVEYFKTNDRGYGNIACGIGKTLMSYWVHKSLNPKITLIAVPSLYLLTQFFKEWVSEAEADDYNPEILLIGSDADYEVDKYVNNGLLLTTDDIEIYKKLALFMLGNNKNLIIITTYQSADKLKFASNILKLKYDFAVVDEAHKTCQQDGHQFSMLLDNKYIKINKRLFLIATPRIYKMSSKKGEDEDEKDIVSMDNEKWYGKEIYKYSIRQGIDGGYLCPYQILTLCTDNVYIDKMIKDNCLVDSPVIKKSNSYYLACAIMIIKSFMENGCNHLVTYHNSIANSKLLMELLETLFPHFKLQVKIYQLDGKASLIKRNKIIKLFTENDKSIMVTARVLNEGVNIPIIDSVCFVDQRESTIDITQCVGRALRPYAGKTLAKVLIPCVFNDINNIEDNTYINKLASVVKAMYDSDEVIKEYFKLDRKGKSINGLIKHKCYFNDEISVAKSEKIDLEKWIDELEIGIWRRVDGFEYMYNKVVEWFKNNDKYPSQVSDDPDEIQLNQWIMSRKRDKKVGRLKDYKIKQLEKLPNFKWDVAFIFDNKINELVEFVEKNKKLPSEWSKNKDEIHLSSWCVRQRKGKREGTLEDEQIKELENIKFWYWDKVDPFEENCNELVKWVHENKKIPSINSKNEIEKKHGQFCVNMRQKKKEGKLTQERIDKLEKINGWYWSKDTKKKFQTFDEKYKDIKEWVEKNNELPSAYSKDEEEARIGRLCGKLRANYKKNKLIDTEIKLLEQIHNWFWESDTIVKSFDENYEEFKIWLIGHHVMPSKYIYESNEEKRLGEWIDRLKARYKKNKVSKEDYEKLEKLPYWNIYKEKAKKQKKRKNNK